MFNIYLSSKWLFGVFFLSFHYSIILVHVVLFSVVSESRPVKLIHILTVVFFFLIPSLYRSLQSTE